MLKFCLRLGSILPDRLSRGQGDATDLGSPDDEPWVLKCFCFPEGAQLSDFARQDLGPRLKLARQGCAVSLTATDQGSLDEIPRGTVTFAFTGGVQWLGLLGGILCCAEAGRTGCC
jgi:hypothetical protein